MAILLYTDPVLYYAMKSKDSTQLEESRIYVTKTKPSAKALGTRKI